MGYRLKLIQWMPKLQRILANKGLRGLSVPCKQYFKRNRKHLAGGLTVLCVFAIVGPVTIISTTKNRSTLSTGQELPEYETWQHNFAKDAETDEAAAQYGVCRIKPPRHPSHPMNPILAASFPDGSPDLMRFLIEGTTGLLTGAGTSSDDVVAVKTHYPYYENHASSARPAEATARNGGADAPPVRALVVLRDPLDSMESWMNWVLNTVHETDQALRASMENWVKWRDRHFREEIKRWDVYLRYWLDTAPADSTFVVVHEHLMHEDTGPAQLTDIVQFMRKVADIPKDVPIQNIPCLWHHILKVHPVNNLSVNLDDRPYTFEDLDLAAGLLAKLIDDYSHQRRVVTMLLQYKDKVMHKMHRLQQTEPVMITNAMGTCMVTNPKHEKMTPAYLASYPGSGSGMLRELIEAMTGIKTAETKRRNNVVAIQTSYPAIHNDIHTGLWNRDMKRAILLIRNPLNAIYSYHNHIFWQKNDLMQHSLQAPQEAWEQWRDKNFLKELDKWIEHLHYWFKQIDSVELMVLNYEWLIHDGRGPRQGTRLAMFLDGSSGEQDSAPALTVPCLWFRAVKVRNPASVAMDKPTYTMEQLEHAVAKLSGVSREYIFDLLLGPVLKSYFEDTLMQIPLKPKDIE